MLETLIDERELDEVSRSQLRAFASDGYLIVTPQIPDFEAKANDIIAGCSERDDYEVRTTDAWRTIPAVRSLATAPVILSLLEKLYGREAIPMQTLNFARGSEQRPHSDAFHFSTYPQGFMCGVWVALEDVDLDNGPVEYYPGSHKLPYLDHSHIGNVASGQESFELYAEYEDLVQTLIRELGLERRYLTVKAGQALIWSANLLHGGAPITHRSRSRHSQVTHYYFGETLHYQPQRSDPFLGKVEWLDKQDIRSGKTIPQSYGGRSVLVKRTLKQHLKMWARKSGLRREHIEAIANMRSGWTKRD